MVEEDHSKVQENIRKVIGGETTKGSRYTGKKKDGSTFPIQVFSSRINDGENTVGVRGIIYDITAIVKTQEELMQSNELFKTLLESIPVMITLSDLQGRMILANQTFCKFVGRGQETMVGKALHEIGLNSETDCFKMVEEHLITKGNHENFETKIFDPEGNGINVICSFNLVKVNNRDAILQTMLDITERKKLENKLKESETLFRLMVDMVPYSITITDSQEHYTFANKAFLQKFDFHLNDVLGKTLLDIGFLVGKKALERFHEEYRSQGKVLNFEVSIISPQKKTLSVLLSQQPVIIDGKPHKIATSVDISDRKHLENQLLEYNLNLEYLVKERTEELASANEELKSINEELYAQREELELTLERLKEAQEHLVQTEKMASLGILTAGVAHEINNPINFISNGTMAIESYITERMPEHLEELKPLFGAINTGISRTTGIVKSLNKYSRKEDSSFFKCNIHETIDNCLTMLFNQYKNRIEIIKDYSEEIPEIMAKEGQLHQVFLNILLNAIQAIEENGTITLKTYVEKDKAKIQITDTGKGIKSEDMKHIFDPFFTTKDPGMGTGLGLSITRRIIQEHKGSIYCKSQPKHGAEFLIVIPINH
jgi:PAS domain S-box-containing protein